MDKQSPILLHCPNCKERKDNVSLGSINADGYVILKRQFNRFTLIMAESYSIICDCGYFVRVSNGRIVADASAVKPLA